MDINIAKFVIPVHIRKAFDKGQVDKVYKEMYLLADQLAAHETRIYMARKPSELLDEKIQLMKGAKAKRESWSTRVMKQISDYKARRLKCHLDNMYKLLELYARTKTTIPTL